MDMDNRTEPQSNKITESFFEKYDLEAAVLLFLINEEIQKLVDQGYLDFLKMLDESVENAPDELKDLAKNAAEQTRKSKEEYEKALIDVFDNKFEELFGEAANTIDIREKLIALLFDAKDAKIIRQFENAIEELANDFRVFYANMVFFLDLGIIEEEAVKYCEIVGKTLVCPIGCFFVIEDDGDTDGES
jgi:hypothetical protein